MSLVAEKRQKWIQYYLMHDEDNRDETDAATVSSSLQLTTVPEVSRQFESFGGSVPCRTGACQ